MVLQGVLRPNNALTESRDEFLEVCFADKLWQISEECACDPSMAESLPRNLPFASSRDQSSRADEPVNGATVAED
jgi:hypothetical protein